MKILAINPGSTSTKIAVFEDKENVFTKTLRHSTEVIAQYANVIDQYEFRMDVIASALKENGYELGDFDAIIGRGGLVKPISSGTYSVNDRLVEDLRNAVSGEHASNLGGILARELSIAGGKNAPAFIADPVVVDELDDVARISGHPLFPRVSIFHALNQKAIAKTYAAEVGKKYEELNLIVVHMGGGISVSAHRQGKVVDTNDALNGDGPFSPERSGSLPALALAKVCFSGKYNYDEVKKMINGKGGTNALLGTNDFMEIEKKFLEGDKEYTLVVKAFIYQIAKEIGAMAAVLDGNVDAILLTGGIAYGKPLMNLLVEKVKFIAPVKIYPGEDEMKALAVNALNVITGVEKAKVYE